MTHLFGIPEHADRTAEVAANNEIPNVVDKVEDMVGGVDAAMVVFRHGGLHLKHAQPFLKAGIPTFVDKPLACSVKDAKAILSLAKRKQCLMTSFSTYRISKATADLAAELQQIGPVTAGTITGPCDIKSEYGGVYFYGIHVVELMMALFGPGVESVRCTTHKGNTAAAVTYKKDKLITLNLLGNAGYVFHVMAFGKSGWKAEVPSSQGLYTEGLRLFLEMINTGARPLMDPQMLESIKVLAALDRSLKRKGGKVALKDVK